MKTLFFLIPFLLSLQILSQTKDSFSSIKVRELNNKIRLNYILVDQPINKVENNKFLVFLELSGGVAGGGRVYSGEGILVRPNAGLYYHIDSGFSINIAGGQMISPFGNVNSTNINIGLT